MLKKREAQQSGARTIVQIFRVITEKQFDFWIGCLNQAAKAMAWEGEQFTHDDRQKTISYWYILMYLLEIYAGEGDPFAVKKNESWLSQPLLSMSEFAEALADRYKEETVRRYVFDLKSRGLIALKGRGGSAQLQLSAPAIFALASTIRHWVQAFRDVDKRIERLG